ncbi:MAG: DUF262 domain-containing protein [Marinilabiliales bacterium]
MKAVQKPDHVSLNSLISRLKEGRFVIPDFQRDFEWKPWDIRELIRSIFLDYYIGSLLFWKGNKENFDALSCEIIYGFDNTTGEQPWTYGKGKPEYIVLDGQQRLTALYYAFVAPNVSLPNRASRAIFFIHVDKFMNEKYDEAFQYDWLSKRFESKLSDIELQYEEHFFPLSIMGTGSWDLPNWLQGYQKYWEQKAEEAKNTNQEEFNIAQQHAINAKDFGEYIKGITEEYQIAFIELDEALAIDKVCDIFTQINSRGIRLDVFDLINALLKPKGLQLKLLWRDSSKRLDFVETEKMNVYVLQVMSILKQAYCSPKYLYYLLPGQEKQIREPDGSRKKEILIKDVNEFEEQWNKAVDAIENSINLLKHPQEYGVSSSKYLPYVSILPVFSALQDHIKKIPFEDRLNAQRKLRHWYWASVFTNRYSGSVESTSARDFLSIKEWFENDDSEPSLLYEFKYRYRNIELRKETKRGSSVYNGIFNLLVINGARDWVSGNIPINGNVDDHHIVPASWGKMNISGNLINSILNRTPLTAETNRNIIGDKLPNEYLPLLIQKNGKAKVEEILETHFITKKALDILLRNPFTKDDFEEFIIERQKLIYDAIENLLIKERLDLPIKFRELDESIELVELSLRNLIFETLENKDFIPEHIKVKTQERIKRAAQKNPAFDAEKYEKLEGILEFFDLREIQDLIISKSLWSKFQEIFLNKETLLQKFNQLAELRNGIRHSRTVDEITQKEGEASILWFNKVLNIS